MVERNLDDVEFGCKLQYEYIKEKLKKNGFGKMLYNDNDMNKARCKGRVEGEIRELKDSLATLKAIDSELDRRNVDMMLKTLIKIKEKRLKELEEICIKRGYLKREVE